MIEIIQAIQKMSTNLNLAEDIIMEMADLLATINEEPNHRYSKECVALINKSDNICQRIVDGV